MHNFINTLNLLCLLNLPLSMQAQKNIIQNYDNVVESFDGNDILTKDGTKISLKLVYDDQLLILTRHGEKADFSKNAELSEAGEARSERLSKILRKAPVADMVYSSDFIRTINTIKPYCLSKNINWQLYNPANQAELAAKLTPYKRILISGHSNSVPALINLLTGSNMAELDEDDYSNLFFVKIPKNGPKTIYIFKY
ncbi:MAG TPA: phosphoglycerate mutase family protein [Saprospiraceae bacterium]|nr:histidine phosphatase family protein [Saprospiraceae bacterium]MCC6689530.1 histidine phosphatase family protein [Saprospiraceae bacterium]HMX84909.1 phosphoglycerate mutase family protein [Saprospiraceae bacterium]HMZ72097.1 phosphoglycerate mutase family protein [Saprospiraceae bacterium]HNA41814.1 phosphoglycerate mutase family protein [Saprospiraceae bacterium]